MAIQKKTSGLSFESTAKKFLRQNFYNSCIVVNSLATDSSQSYTIATKAN